MQMRTMLFGLTLLGLVAFVVPPSTAQAAVGINNPNVSTPTTLYFHVSGFDDFPINTQPPSDEFSADPVLGLGTASSSCAGQDPVPGFSAVGEEHHTFYGYSSPGFVEYNVIENGKPRVHPERGLSYDVQIDSAKDWTLHWFLKTQVVASNENTDPNQAPIVVPNVVVKATIKSGDSISINDVGYNKGDLIAEGKSAPITLAGDLTAQINSDKTGFVGYTKNGNDNIYEYAIKLEQKSATIPKLTGYNVRVDVYMDNPACNNPPTTGYTMPNNVRIYTAPQFRPRMEMSVMNPVRIEYMHPEFVGDELVVHTSENSPWGNYDVNNGPGGVELHIKGPGFEADPPKLARAAFVQRFHEHNFHTKAVDVTYAWPYKDDKAGDGTYTVSLSVKNLQESATATGTTTFQLGKELIVAKCGAVDQGTGATAKQSCVSEDQTTKANPGAAKKSPGVAPMLAVGLMAVAAFVTRRRQA